MTIAAGERQGTIIPGAVTDADGRLVVIGANGAPVGGGLPAGATQTNATSGNQANANAVATLGAVAAKTNWITGFEMTFAGATAAGVVVATVTGLIGGTISFVVAVPAGAAVQGQPLLVEFPEPIQASAVNTAIVVTLPALGAGNTNAVVNAHGYVV